MAYRDLGYRDITNDREMTIEIQLKDHCLKSLNNIT